MCYEKRIFKIANILEKCSNMSKLHRLHGEVGNSETSLKEEHERTVHGQGARLKFFKDGKFILELKKTFEGERVTWVSVHKKTYWPPQDTLPEIHSSPQETTTLLSDDNSSVQSSPWQRDHSSKQLCPRKNISSEMNLYYWKSKKQRVVGNGKKQRNEKKPLLIIIQSLIDRNFQSGKVSGTEIVVSPRKRYLPDMEVDKTLAGDSCQKRSRSKPQTVITSCSSFGSTSPSVIPDSIEPNTIPSSRNYNHSIKSLLAEDYVHKKSFDEYAEDKTLKLRSLTHLAPKEDGWYSESLDRLRSIELSHSEKCSISPSYHPHQSLPGPFQPVRSYYSPGLYDRGYFLPYVHHELPLPLGIQQETSSCSWNLEEGWKGSRSSVISDKPLDLSKYPG